MKVLIKKMFIILGLATLIGNSIVLYIVFLSAYFNGYTTRVFVNNYGEANMEFILFPVAIIAGFYMLRMFLFGKARLTNHSIKIYEGKQL